MSSAGVADAMRQEEEIFGKRGGEYKDFVYLCPIF